MGIAVTYPIEMSVAWIAAPLNKNKLKSERFEVEDLWKKQAGVGFSMLYAKTVYAWTTLTLTSYKTINLNLKVLCILNHLFSWLNNDNNVLSQNVKQPIYFRKSFRF